jgi:hypothetical protein
MWIRARLLSLPVAVTLAVLCWAGPARADSVNSPNITLNVDTNRNAGNGAGNVSVAVSTITLAEITLPEYSAGGGQAIILRPRPGFALDPTSPISAVSETIGINGQPVNEPAIATPTLAGAIIFELTSGSSAAAQDIIRVNGIKVLIASAAGAAGPGQSTMEITTSTAGGAFTDQGIVAAIITKGVADHLAFTTQPVDAAASVSLEPVVGLVDFGGNLITNDSRVIVLNLQNNPGAAVLAGINGIQNDAGVAAWTEGDGLHIDVAADEYTLRASHDGPPLQSSDTVDSDPFAILAGPPATTEFSLQPSDTPAGASILAAVTVRDAFGNVANGDIVFVTLALSSNPTDTELLGATPPKPTLDGVATWEMADAVRINAAASGYRLSAAGVGDPVVSDAFAITAGTAAILQFVREPVDATEGAVVAPAVAVEALDAFGNRATGFDGAVALALAQASCGGALLGGGVEAEAGLATFSDLLIERSCTNDVLAASATGLIGVLSEPFDVAPAADARPIAATLVQLKPGKIVKLVAKGPVALPDRVTDDPRRDGGSITVVGTTGTVTFALPASGWRGLGPNKDGSKGFRFTGGACKLVAVKPKIVTAICRGNTGTLRVPEPGPVEVVLRVGGGTARYCAACGGTAKGNAAKVFKRAACAKPAACR